MKLQGLVALALCGLTQGFSIHSSVVQPPTDIIGEHQPLERSWTIVGEVAEFIGQLNVHLPGRTFVSLFTAPLGAFNGSYPGNSNSSNGTHWSPLNSTHAMNGSSHASNYSTVLPPYEAMSLFALNHSLSIGNGSFVNATGVASWNGTALVGNASVAVGHGGKKILATIVATGSSSDLLEAIEISQTEGLTVQLRNQNAALEGFLLTQIYLADAHSVEHLEANAFNGDLVVEQDVVVAHAAVNVNVAGKGNVFVATDKAMNLHASEDATVVRAEEANAVPARYPLFVSMAAGQGANVAVGNNKDTSMPTGAILLMLVVAVAATAVVVAVVKQHRRRRSYQLLA